MKGILEISLILLSESSQFVDQPFETLDRLSELERHPLAALIPPDLDPFSSSIGAIGTAHRLRQRFKALHIDQIDQLLPFVGRERVRLLHRRILILRIIGLFQGDQLTRIAGDVHRSATEAHAHAERGARAHR